MRTFYTFFTGLLVMMLLLTACGGNSAVDSNDAKAKAKQPYILKETVATGDTGMAKFSGIKKNNEMDIICQHWEMPATEGATSSELLTDKNGDRFTPGLDLFADSSFSMNPRGDYKSGTWRITRKGEQLMLTLTTSDKKEMSWELYEYSSRSLRLLSKNPEGKELYLNLSADGLVHRNKLNDPFHPVNNQWRIKPSTPENDSAIARRMAGYVKFYTLFYRDNILRLKDKINFAGLPTIFQWYSRGIGMPDWEDVKQSWLDCFYDTTQARKGYNVLRKVIVNYEFNWPKGAPDWRMETESVLEQMYHKM